MPEIQVGNESPMLSFSEMFTRAGFSYSSCVGANGVFICLLPVNYITTFHKCAKCGGLETVVYKFCYSNVIYFKL